jgi:L-asparaginase
VEKEDARPGGYRAVQDHGVVGTIGPPVTIWSRPAALHTFRSEVNLAHLPTSVPGVRRENGGIVTVSVTIKTGAYDLRAAAIPKVTTVKYNRYIKDSVEAPADEEVEMLARIERNLRSQPLSGFIVEGLVAAGNVQESLEKAIDIASMSGMPVARVTRGDEAAMVPPTPGSLTIAGRDLTPIKARLLLMACLLKFGALPPASDPRNPTEAEKNAVRGKIALYQHVFDTH